MAEIRTTSSTGGEKGVKPQRYGLLPRRGLDAIAEVFAFGATKYADNNWRRGYEWDKSFDALLRHAYAAQDGETYDEESGLPHLAHAGFHVLVLLTWLFEQGEGADNPFDTRWPAGMERARREIEAADDKAAHERFMRLDAIRKDLENGLEPYTDEECYRQDGGMLPEMRPSLSQVIDRITERAFADTRTAAAEAAGFKTPEPVGGWQTIGWIDESQRWDCGVLDDFIGTVNEETAALAAYSVPARFIVGVDGTKDCQEFTKNVVAVRRRQDYDEEWLRETLPEPTWVTDYDREHPPTRWDRG